MKYIESGNQQAFVAWCKIKGYPYSLIYAVENEGQKTPQAGARAKRMGKRAGVCDLFFPVIRGGYGGLYIEMKAPKGTVSASQKAFIKDMVQEGYLCEICYSAEQAIEVATAYEKLRKE